MRTSVRRPDTLLPSLYGKRELSWQRTRSSISADTVAQVRIACMRTAARTRGSPPQHAYNLP